MNMKKCEIPINVKVSKKDIEKVSAFHWTETHNGYFTGRINGKKLYLHRFIMNAQKGQIVDHINRNTLDNRRSNLRFVTYSENAHNKTPTKNGINALGVSYHKKAKKFTAEIRKDNKKYYLGLFNNIKDAEIAYLNKDKELYGC